MTAKKLVENFYKSDVLLDPELTAGFLHDQARLEWHSSKGFLEMSKSDIVALSRELSKAYVRSKSRIGSIVAEGNQVAIRYSHFVKTIENPREEMLLAHFIVIWEIRDGKLYHGWQMSQLS